VPFVRLLIRMLDFFRAKLGSNVRKRGRGVSRSPLHLCDPWSPSDLLGPLGTLWHRRVRPLTMSTRRYCQFGLSPDTLPATTKCPLASSLDAWTRIRGQECGIASVVVPCHIDVLDVSFLAFRRY